MDYRAQYATTPEAASQDFGPLRKLHEFLVAYYIDWDPMRLLVLETCFLAEASKPDQMLTWNRGDASEKSKWRRDG